MFYCVTMQNDGTFCQAKFNNKHLYTIQMQYKLTLLFIINIQNEHLSFWPLEFHIQGQLNN